MSVYVSAAIHIQGRDERMNRRDSLRGLLLLALPCLAACAAGMLDTPGPQTTQSTPPAPSTWQAQQPAQEKPHAGSTARLADWWAQFNDLSLDALIAAAQEHSSTLAQAAATIARSRADAIAAGVAAAPNLDAIASANKAAFTFGGPLAYRTQAQLGVQSSWEIDLFGGLAHQRESAQASLEANLAAWHDARVSLAAEVAGSYFSLRLCQIQLVQTTADAHSLAQTASMTAAAGTAGLQSHASVALAQSAAAEAAASLSQRRAQCEISVKSLVALSAIEESALRALLAASAPSNALLLPEPQRFAIDSVPARVLAQRPDVAAAERRLAAARADIGQAEAQRYPRLTLAGSITPTRIALGAAPALALTTWSIGPSLLLPLFDSGRRDANLHALRAQYAAADAHYRAKVRAAVREVEEALVRLASAAERAADSATGARGYRTNFSAAQSRLQAGLGSRLDTEAARRLSLAGEATLVALAQERLAAWIALYRAVGGGWEPDTPGPPDTLKRTSP